VDIRRHIGYLQDAGIEVSEADADNAVRTAVSAQPDIIVVDFSGGDGDVTKALKANADTQNIPVVALVEMLKR
jgi:DNA-binding response OmpR family regulator